MSPTIRRLAMLGVLLVLPAARQAQAMPWVLAMPPINYPDGFDLDVFYDWKNVLGRKP